MTSVTTDRRYGVNSGIAAKVPCRAATTAAITLSGLQTIDGVVLAAADRVLVKNQTSGVDNGIYDVATGTWTRSVDFDGSYDVKRGSFVLINEGTINAVTAYRLMTSDPITIGSTALTFSLANVLAPLNATTVTSIALLRLLPAVTARAIVLGYYAAGDGGGGTYYYDSTDTTSADNGGTIIVAADAARWKLSYQNSVSVKQFGAKGDGATDDRVAFQAAIDALTTGGEVWCPTGATYKITAGGSPTDGVDAAGIVLKDKIKLKLNGSTLNISCSTTNGVALWVYGSNCHLELGGGAVNCLSSGSPGSQGFFHAGISIGLYNGDPGTVASPSPRQTINGWKITGPGSVSTTKAAFPACAIQGMSGVHHGEISDIDIPDSATMSGIHFDWGFIGTYSSANLAAAKTAFNAGLMYTTHPHNIRIRNIKVGALTLAPSGDTGGYGVRLSGCYGITIERIQAQSCSQGLFLHTGGDAGFEYALAADKKQAYKCTTLRDGTLYSQSATGFFGVFVDTLGDNVYREQFISGYVALANPLWHAQVLIENVHCVGGLGSNTYGARIIQARGVTVRNCTFQSWDIGVLVDEFTQDINIDDNSAFANNLDGIRVGQAALRENTERINVRRNRSYGNGIAGTGRGVNVLRLRNGNIDDNVLGTVSEATQGIGIFTSDVSLLFNVNIRRNHTFGATVAGYSLGGSVGPYFYNAIGEFASNTADLSNPQAPIVASQSWLPIRNIFFGSRWAKEFLSNTASLPSATGHWRSGDLLFQATAVANTPDLASCTTSGSFGTLSGLTNGSTSNTSKVITCSLAATTCNTTADTYSVVVASATNLREGLLVSIGSGGGSNMRILSVSGTTIQLDTPVVGTLVGATFTTAGLVEGEIISLNTTPARTSCTVMAINGTSVTLDTSIGSTESGRTLTYTTPIFKNHAAIAA